MQLKPSAREQECPGAAVLRGPELDEMLPVVQAGRDQGFVMHRIELGDERVSITAGRRLSRGSGREQPGHKRRGRAAL